MSCKLGSAQVQARAGSLAPGLYPLGISTILPLEQPMIEDTDIELWSDELVWVKSRDSE